MTDFNSLKTESRNLKSADIDKMSALEIAQLINEEDKTVAFAVTEALESIARGIDAMADALKNGGRIFYIGAGTSGRARRAGRLGMPAHLRRFGRHGHRHHRRRTGRGVRVD